MAAHLQKRKVYTHWLKSQVFGSPRALKIFLPLNYREDRAYPVLYLQDGQDYFVMGRIATLAQELISRGLMQECLLVGVGVERRRRWSEYHPHGEQFHLYQKFLLHEIIPYMDAHYSTLPFARHRAIGGASLGAVAALWLAGTHPGTFSAVVAQSGAFSPEIQGQIWELDLRYVRIYQSVGLLEHRARTPLGVWDILGWNRKVAERLKEKEASLHYREIEEGEHTWGLWQKDLPAVLTWLFPANADARG